MNLTKYVWDMYEESYKNSDERNKKIKWMERQSIVHELEESILLRCQFLPTWPIDCEIPVRIPASYFVDNDTLTLKCRWRDKMPRIVNTVLKNKVFKLTSRNFKIYYKVNHNQDGVLSTREQKNKSTELNREPKDRSTQVESTALW